jgi:hypothetical protein
MPTISAISAGSRGVAEAELIALSRWAPNLPDAVAGRNHNFFVVEFALYAI